MKEKIKKYFGEILLVVGSFMTTYMLFSFKSSFYGSSKGLLPSLSLSSAVGDPAVYYYYNDKSLFLLSLGVALIISGILIIKKKNEKLAQRKLD